jgi:hypothetical protein
MIRLLNEDLAGEYQAIIAYTVYSQVLTIVELAKQVWLIPETIMADYRRQRRARK